MPAWPCVTSILRRVGDQSTAPKPVIVIPPDADPPDALAAAPFGCGPALPASDFGGCFFGSGFENNAIWYAILP